MDTRSKKFIHLVHVHDCTCVDCKRDNRLNVIDEKFDVMISLLKKLVKQNVK